jgi:hypothetical protein
MFNSLFDEANELSEDPLHCLLIFLRLFAQARRRSMKEHDIYQGISLHSH